MKKILFFLIFLVFISETSALILLDDLNKQVYNIGDTITVSGYILEEQDNYGRFSLELDCEKKTPMLMRAINIRRGEKYEFSENLPVSLTNTGLCKVLASFTVNTIIIDQSFTKGFKIAQELDGNFTIEENLVQLGKDIDITGIITKKDKTPIEGIGLLYFLLINEIHFIEKVEIKDGQFKLLHDSSENLPGKYLVNIEVNDIYGNRGNFQNILEFTLVNEISVFAESNKETVLPGSTVTIFGEANTILQESIEEGIATIYFNEQQFRTKLKRNGQYDYKIDIPQNMKSGSHKIKVIVDDKYGNRGEGETRIEISPVPTTLELNKIEGTFRPEDKIIITPLLYDQANDSMSEVINIEIINPNKEAIFTDSVESGSQIEFQFPEMSLPGVWRIMAATSGISKEQEFHVGELYSLDFKLENQTLIVENTGNTKYKNPIEIKLTSSDVESTLIKKTSLNPREILKINLGREVKTGTYDIEILDKRFEDIYITGIGKKPFNTIYWVLIILILLFILYIVFIRKKRKIIRKIREKRALEKLPKKTIDDTNKIKRDFRNTILKQIEERERKITKGLKFNFKQAKNKGKGILMLGRDKLKEEKTKEEEKKESSLFDMFN